MADSLDGRLRPRETAALGALGFIVAVTAIWWALALWPVPGEVPDWLARTRAFCFGAAPHGLPSPSGWLLLIGEPVAMLIALLIIAGSAVPAAFRVLAAHRLGQTALATAGLLTCTGLTAAGVRVARATNPAGQLLEAVAKPEAAERLNAVAPPLMLRDQRGEVITLDQFRGRVVLVAFAFGHCETVCPAVVAEVLRARDRLAEPPAVLIVTLDPWRDTPTRLPDIAARWHLYGDAFLLGGGIADVERALDAWKIPRTRDDQTGDVTHATPVYVVGRDGHLAYRAGPFADAIAEVARRL